jgi:hypothetical protein
MHPLAYLFAIGMILGGLAAVVAKDRINAFVAIVGTYGIALSLVGFVAIAQDVRVLPYLVPWVTTPAIGSLLGGVCVVLTRPGVINWLWGEPVSMTQAAATGQAR